MIMLKTMDEIDIMEANGAIVVECFALARDFIRPGRTRKELDAAIEQLIVERGGRLMAIGTAQQPIVFTSDQPVGMWSRSFTGIPNRSIMLFANLQPSSWRTASAARRM